MTKAANSGPDRNGAIGATAAMRLLESTHEPIKVVARRTGFGDDERMRRANVKSGLKRNKGMNQTVLKELFSFKFQKVR